MTEPAKNDDGAEAQKPDQPIAEAAPEPNPQAAENSPTVTAKTRRGPPLPAVLIVGAVVLVLLGALATGVSKWMLAKSPAPDAATATAASAGKAAKIGKATGPLAAYARGSLAHLQTFAAPQNIADIGFIDRDKKPVRLSDFKGKVVLLNVWATWCAPCRVEMPTLAKLQADNMGKAFKVLPLSVDTEDKFADVKSFIDVQQPLEVYADQEFQAPQMYNISGMPVTLILDKSGREVARLDGEATWDTPEVQALVDKLLSE